MHLFPVGFVGIGSELYFRRGDESGFDVCKVFFREVTAGLEGTKEKVKIRVP